MQLLTLSLRKFLSAFLLTDDALLSIVGAFKTQLVNGLSSSEPDNSLVLYPTYISDLPTGQETGDYLALDLGGTNFRVLLIHLDGNSRSVVKNKKYSVSTKLMSGTGDELFNYIAKCVHEFVKDNGLLGKRLPLGFTFSFPCHQTNKSTAVLSQWTKGFSASGVVGNDVGQLLSKSLKRYEDVDIEIVAIVNDTAGTLVSCAYQAQDCRVGVIVGTGVNACYMEERLLNSRMIINTELGAFGSKNNVLQSVLTEWDRAVDKSSINVGEHLFEKMVSGMYLGEIVRQVLHSYAQENPDYFGKKFNDKISEFDAFPTSFLSEIELDNLSLTDDHLMPNTVKVLRQIGLERPNLEQCEILHFICSTVSTRSAHLVASVLAGLLSHLQRPFTVVGFDGTVYRCHPHFRSRVEKQTSKLLELIGCKEYSFRFMLSEDGSGRGAALTAALPIKVGGELGAGKICAQCKAQVFLKRHRNDCPQCLSVAISV